MGNFVSEPIKKMLTKYTYNFNKEQLSLQILKGNFKIENLIINDQEVNKVLAEKGLPFKLKFGLLKKFEMKMSIIGTKIEKLEVEDLFIIMGPERISDSKVEGIEEEKMYSLVLKNLRKEKKKERSKDFLNPKVLFKHLEEEYLSKRPKADTKNGNENEKKGGVNIMGTEIFNIVKHFLDIDIAIKNITFIYEDNLEFIYSKENLETFITTVTFKEFRFKTDDIQRNTDKNGIFKNFFNIQNFLKKSGTWSDSNVANWNFTVQNVSVSFSVSNPLFMNNMENNHALTSKQIGLILKRFYENLKLDKLENSFDLVAFNKVTLDLVMFYKNSSKIPIHAAFMLLDLHEIILNTEINKIAVVLDVLAFFSNLGKVKQISLVKPKFRILTPNTFNKLAAKMKLNGEQKSLLMKFNRYVIKEYFMESIYLIRYSTYLAEKIKPDFARLLIIKHYCEESKIYNLIFGGKYPQFINDEIKERQEQMQQEKKEKEREASKTPEQKLREANQRIEKGGQKRMNENKNVLILNRIHIHFRTHLNFRLNILSSDTLQPQYSLMINRCILDLVNPAAHLRAKIHFNIDSILFNFNRDMYPIVNKKKMGIFNTNKNNSRMNKSLMVNSSPNMLELRHLSLSTELSMDQNREGDNVYFIYADSQFGPLIYNYHPVVFKDLVKTFIEMSWAFQRNFKFKLAKEVDQQIKDLNQGKYFAQKKKIGLAFKNKAFEKKVNKINDQHAKETYRRFGEKKFKHLYDSQRNLSFKSEQHKIKKSNVTFDFNHTNKKKKAEFDDFQKKMGDKDIEVAQETQEHLQKEENQVMLENLTRLFQTIVLHFTLKTKPMHLNIFDIDNNEALSLKYDDEEIKMDVDLAFKEIITVKAFGLELQSRKSLFALRSLIERIMANMNEIKEYQKMAG